MTTGAFSKNVDNLFFELKLVTDNLLFIYTNQLLLFALEGHNTKGGY